MKNTDKLVLFNELQGSVQNGALFFPHKVKVAVLSLNRAHLKSKSIPHQLSNIAALQLNLFTKSSQRKPTPDRTLTYIYLSIGARKDIDFIISTSHANEEN